jgi:alkylation response protein AidB-like acyl-CoA dehydrogenase
MDFDFSPGEKAFFAQLATELASVSSSEDDGGGGGGGELDARLRRDLARLAATPYLAMSLTGDRTPSGTAALLAAVELVASRSPSLGLAVESSARLFGRAVAAFGTKAQRDRWLAPVVGGTKVAALALPESTMSVVNAPLTTRGEPLGDDVVVTGAKGFVVNAPLADLFAVVGLVGDRQAIFLVDRDAEGLRIGQRLATSAFAGAAISGLSLDRCRVAAGDVVHAPEGVDLVATLRRWESLVAIGICLGLMRTCFEAAKKHARTHTSGGEGGGVKPIVKHQEVSFKLAEMLTLHQTSRLLAFRAAWLEDTGSDDAAAVTSCAKVFCTESAEQVSSAALQVLSTAGIVTPNPVETAFRCAKHVQIAGTSTEIARVQIGDDALQRWG